MPEQSVFPPTIVQAIHDHAQGIPRLINSICDNLLLTSFASGENVATAEMLDEVCRDMRLELPDRRHAVAASHPVF
jgi:general secretion pathway protein A